MKKVLGWTILILLVLGILIFMVGYGCASGATLIESIVGVLMLVAIALVLFGLLHIAVKLIESD